MSAERKINLKGSMSPVRSLLSQPHDEDRSRGQGEHGQQLEPDSGIGNDASTSRALQILQKNADAKGLDDADEQGPVTGVLGNLLPPELAFLGQPFQIRPDNLEKLQDDRGADVRHDAQGENRHPGHVPPGEQVDESEDRSLLSLPEFSQGSGTDPGVGNLGSDPVNGQQKQGENHPFPEIGNAEDVADTVDHFASPMRMACPPAFSIFLRAD
jgi:hypothetical protein